MRLASMVIFVAGILGATLEPIHSADDPRRPAAIQAEHVPAIPDDLAERLRQYEQVRSAAFAGWSPDGKGMLIRTRFGDTAQLHRVYTPGGRREQVTFFDEPVSGRFLPGAAPGTLLVEMSQGGSENNQIFRVDPETGKATLLTDGKSRNILGPVREDGQAIAVASTRRNGRDTDLYLVDPRDGKTELMLQTDGEFWTVQDWSSDGERWLLKRYVSINESYPAVFELATKTLQPLRFPGEGPAGFGPMAFLRFSRSQVLAACDPLGEFKQLHVDLSCGGIPGGVAPDLAWDVEELDLDRNSGRIAFAINENGGSRLFVMDRNYKNRREAPLPLGIVGGVQFSPDGAQLGFTLARPDGPADVYSWTPGDGQVVRWTYSEAGGLNPANFVVPKNIEFPSFDGRKVPAFIYTPRHASPDKKVPVLISIHGGPESQSRPSFSGITQFYVQELGFAVVYPNVRGSDGYGKTYLTLDNGPLREDSVRDIGGLLDWIATQSELDASRVAVTGGSYGGYMVLASLVHFSDRLRGGIDIVGISNFQTFLQNTSAYRRDLRRAEYGDERDAEMQKVFERINPANHAEKITANLLVAHGKNDPRVPFSEAEQIVAKVRGQGRTVWTVYADNEGHGFAKKPNADYLTSAAVLFLQACFESSAAAGK